jgi:transposase-like protein
MVPKKRKSYTCEFKIETVKLVTEGGASANQVADDMGNPPAPPKIGWETLRV